MRNLSAALDLVEPFVSVDPARLAMHKPARYTMHVVASDGHTLAAARYDGQGTAPSRELNQEHGAPPPWEAILPKTLKCIGELNRSDIEAFSHYPAKWWVGATLEVDGSIFIEAKIPAKTGKHGKVLRPSVCMIPRVKIAETALRPEAPIGLDPAYVARCFEAATMGVLPACYVMASGQLDPVVFACDAPATDAELKTLPQFALMMPMRI